MPQNSPSSDLNQDPFAGLSASPTREDALLEYLKGLADLIVNRRDIYANPVERKIQADLKQLPNTTEALLFLHDALVLWDKKFGHYTQYPELAAFLGLPFDPDNDASPEGELVRSVSSGVSSQIGFLIEKKYFEPIVSLADLARRILEDAQEKEYSKANHGYCNEVERILSDFNFSHFDSKKDETTILPLEELLSTANPAHYRNTIYAQLKKGPKNLESNVSFSLGYICKAYKLLQDYEKFFKNLPKLDFAKIDQDRAEYGAKAANLLALEAISAELNKILRPCYIQINIPEFKLLGTEVYRRWLAGEDISVDLSKIYTWANSRKIIVRSSARYSEDREGLTGAGVYDSVPLEVGARFEDFKAAVLKVYQSVNSDLACEYRRKNNVSAHEEMGLVIQLFSDMASPAYVNTGRPGIPEIIEVVDQGGEREIFKKFALEIETIVQSLNTDDLKETLLIPFDASRGGFNFYKFFSQAVLAYSLEKIWGRPVQVECLTSERTSTIDLVQVRPLPETFAKKMEVNFPAGVEPIYSTGSLGVFDKEFEILGESKSNRDKEGALLITTSFGFLMGHRVLDYFPGKGVVWLFEDTAQISNSGGGHLETRAVERGLNLLLGTGCSNAQLEKAYEGQPWDVQIGRCIPKVLTHFRGYKKVRIVSNGLEARVYAVGEQMPGFNES